MAQKLIEGYITEIDGVCTFCGSISHFYVEFLSPSHRYFFAECPKCGTFVDIVPLRGK